MLEWKNLSVRNNFVPPNNPIIEHPPSPSPPLFLKVGYWELPPCALSRQSLRKRCTCIPFLGGASDDGFAAIKVTALGRPQMLVSLITAKTPLNGHSYFTDSSTYDCLNNLKPHLNSSLKRIILNHSCTCAFVSGQAAPVADTFSTSQGTVLFGGLPLYRIMFIDMEKWIHHVFQ